MECESGRGVSLFRFFFCNEGGDGMFLVVGLGNPGKEYALTRHNVGFMLVDELSRRSGAAIDQEKWQAYSGQCLRWGHKLCFVKPDTYMNRSGLAVARYRDFFKVELSQLLVIHDDLDLAPGRIKLVVGGGAGGHNGIRSLMQCLGGADFLRLKIGIGRPQKLQGSVTIPIEKFVLAPFTEDDRQQLLMKVGHIENGLELLVREGVASAMNLLNVRSSQAEMSG